jgi:hypothetical protein
MFWKPARFFVIGLVAVISLALVSVFGFSRAQAVTSSCRTDINADGHVNLVDYSFLATQWFKTTINNPADFNDDGVVNLIDYSILASQFMSECQIFPDPTATPEPTIDPSPEATPNSNTVGIWVSPGQIAALPTSGPAWQKLVSDSRQSTANPDFTDQDSKGDVYTLAKSLMWAKTPNASCTQNNCRSEVRDTIKKLVETHPVSWNSNLSRWEAPSWDWLGVLRGLGGYVAAADTIDLKNFDPVVDAQFRDWLPKARNAWVFEGGSSARGSVVTAQEMRPNNFGGHAGASRIAVDLYLGDTADLQRAITVYKGMLGDRSAYHEYTGSGNSCSANGCQGFEYGELWYQCNESQPVPIGGLLTEEQRRCGNGFEWPLCLTDYIWEGLQGLIVTAELLHRQGYDSYQWSNQALLRVVQYADTTTYADGNTLPAVGDDQWLVFLIDARYGTNYQSEWGINPGSGSNGKMMGYTDWLYGQQLTSL